jgi:hypothetical protein
MSVYAMLRDYKRLNLSSLSKELPLNYQQFQYFFSESKWNYEDLNNIRINILKRAKTTGFAKEGVLAINDTGSLKPYAKKTDGVSYQYCPSLKDEAYCNVAVGSCFVYGNKHLPLNLKFYGPQAEFLLEKDDPDFRSKLNFAKELIDDALSKNIPFSYIVVDSWYPSSDLIEFIDTFGDKPQCLSLGNQSRKPEGLKKAGCLSLSVSTLSIPVIKYSKQTPMLAIGVYECVDKKKHKFIAEIKSDRNLLFRHPVTKKQVWLQQNELVRLIKKHLWHKARIARYRDAQLPVYSFGSRLKDCSVTIKAFVVFGSWSDEDEKDIHILITNDTGMSYKKVAGLYMQRWGIEQMFRELKDTFYFDHYQVRHQEKIMRYWMLCLLVWSLIYWIKQNAYLHKTISCNASTCNEYKRALLVLIEFSSYAALRKNDLLLTEYFASIKSQRFKNSCFN